MSCRYIFTNEVLFFVAYSSSYVRNKTYVFENFKPLISALTCSTVDGETLK